MCGGLIVESDNMGRGEVIFGQIWKKTVGRERESDEEHAGIFRLFLTHLFQNIPSQIALPNMAMISREKCLNSNQEKYQT